MGERRTAQRGKKGGNRPFSQMYYESPCKIFSSVYIRYLIGAIPLPGENTPLYPARCVFSCRESALSSFTAASPGASLASTPKAFFFSFPFGWQCSKLRLACAQLSSLLFLISKCQASLVDGCCCGGTALRCGPPQFPSMSRSVKIMYNLLEASCSSTVS